MVVFVLPVEVVSGKFLDLITNWYALMARAEMTEETTVAKST